MTAILRKVRRFLGVSSQLQIKQNNIAQLLSGFLLFPKYNNRKNSAYMDEPYTGRRCVRKVTFPQAVRHTTIALFASTSTSIRKWFDEVNAALC